jgi:hypothetical protein
MRVVLCCAGTASYSLLDDVADLHRSRARTGVHESHPVRPLDLYRPHEPLDDVVATFERLFREHVRGMSLKSVLLTSPLMKREFSRYWMASCGLLPKPMFKPTTVTRVRLVSASVKLRPKLANRYALSPRRASTIPIAR